MQKSYKNIKYEIQDDTNICSIALNLLLMVVFLFLTIMHTIYNSKEIVQFRYQNQSTFYDMVKTGFKIM